MTVLRHRSPARADGCDFTDGAVVATLELAQSANAATIAAVADGRGLPDHAVTIALATALQESKLHNLPFGDRDSVGIFQQRPSQGWGSRASLLDPHYSATAFFQHLAQVPGWRTLPVAEAAQAVQRSASGSAYADWEPEARVLAKALTGEVPHGVACSYTTPASASRGLAAAYARDLGAAPAAQGGWRAAAWLVAQSAQYDIVSVANAGMRWTRQAGRWESYPAARDVAYTVGG